MTGTTEFSPEIRHALLTHHLTQARQLAESFPTSRAQTECEGAIRDALHEAKRIPLVAEVLGEDAP